ncbi:MAG: hypothetical protein AAF551_15705 [Bacteroidota bacterium]
MFESPNWKAFLLLALSGLFAGCGGGNNFRKSPLDEIIRDLPRDEVFSIILYDMDAEGNFSKTYFHE